ncbi:sulfatase-like hydrolase/transferase [Opitutaceae bacterium]|nr:sulfatase-like hydrolase/transferase [Opitutaceae bacterium]
MCVAVLLLLTASYGNTPPNVVFIMADDMGYGDLSSYGATDAQTPHIDQLAREGVRFTQFYSNGTECSPTRTALLSGQYQQRIGGLECAIGVGNVGRYDDAIRLADAHQLGLPVSDNVFVQGFKDQGYETVMLGKWHLGYETYFSPLTHGFDHWFGIIGGNSDYFHYVEMDGFYALQEDDQDTKASGHVTDLIADRAVSYLKHRQTSQPFLLYLPFTAPHTPIQGPDDYTPEPIASEVWNKGTREGYVSMVEQLDQAVGKVLNMLQESGLAENTLVIFKSDNGGTSLSRNDPFSGGKGTTWEGGIRVPCIVRWPDRIAANTVSDQTAISMDLTRSLRRIIGANESPLPPDGIDIIAHVEQQNANSDRTLFWRGKRGDRVWRAVREGDMKYMSLTQTGEFMENVFDLATDPAEKNNLAAALPELTVHLKDLLTDWEQEVASRR